CISVRRAWAATPRPAIPWPCPESTSPISSRARNFATGSTVARPPSPAIDAPARPGHPSGSPMRLIKSLIALCFVALGVVVGALNKQPVVVDLWLREVQGRLGLVLLTVLLAGALLG